MNTEQKRSELQYAIADRMWDAADPTALEFANNALDAIREAVAQSPELLEELGLERVGWQTTEAHPRDEYVYQGGRGHPAHRPVFRVRPVS